MGVGRYGVKDRLRQTVRQTGKTRLPIWGFGGSNATEQAAVRAFLYCSKIKKGSGRNKNDESEAYILHGAGDLHGNNERSSGICGTACNCAGDSIHAHSNGNGDHCARSDGYTRSNGYA